MGHLSKKENKTFLVGNKMSAPDFPLFEMLDQFQACCEYYKLDDFYASYPSLKEFKTLFEQLSENQFYLQSTFHTGLPMNACLAVFGSQVGPAVYKPNKSKTPWRKLGDVHLQAA